MESRVVFNSLTLFFLIGLLIGFLAGEYKACPEGKYSADYGCMVK